MVDTGDKDFLHKNENGVDFVYVKTIPYTTNGMDRLKNMLSYFFRLFSVTKVHTKTTKEKPDVIIASSPHPLTCIAGLFIAKRYKVPCIVEIRDLWPESIVEYSKYTKKNIFIKLLYVGEKWIYKKADKIIFTRPGDYEYIKERKWDKKIPQSKCFYINNGVDLETFDYNKEHYKTQDDDLDNDEIFKVVYTGAVRRVNNVGLLVDSAKEIKNQNIKILVWGAGDRVNQLRKRIKEENIDNIVIKGYIEKKYVPYILSKSNLNLLHYEHSNLFRFGTSQNKNFEYLASATPILNTIKIGYDIVLENECGYTIENQRAKEIARGIEKMYELSDEKYAQMCKNALNEAMKYDFSILTEKLIKIIEQ